MAVKSLPALIGSHLLISILQEGLSGSSLEIREEKYTIQREGAVPSRKKELRGNGDCIRGRDNWTRGRNQLKRQRFWRIVQKTRCVLSGQKLEDPALTRIHLNIVRRPRIRRRIEVSMNFENTREMLLEQARLHATPIDFDDLIARGVLEKKGRRYKILSMEELPEYAKVKIVSMSSDGTVTFSKATKRAEKLVRNLTR